MLAVCLIVLGCVMAPLAVVGGWAKSTLTDTDAFVATYAPLAHDPEVQAFVIDQATAEINEKLNLEQLTTRGAGRDQGTRHSPRSQRGAGGVEGTRRPRAANGHPQRSDRIRQLGGLRPKLGAGSPDQPHPAPRHPAQRPRRVGHRSERRDDRHPARTDRRGRQGRPGRPRPIHRGPDPTGGSDHSDRDVGSDRDGSGRLSRHRCGRELAAVGGVDLPDRRCAGRPSTQRRLGRGRGRARPVDAAARARIRGRAGRPGDRDPGIAGAGHRHDALL